MKNRNAELVDEFSGRDALAGGGVLFFGNRRNRPTFPGCVTNFSPRSRRSIADIVHFAGFSVRQRREADPGQVLDMNEIDIFSGRPHPTGSDPVERIATRTVDSSHAQHDRATVRSEKLFASHPGFGQIDRRRFVDPRWRILR